MSGAVPLSGELDGWTQQMRTIAESSCLRISLISHSLAGMKVRTLLVLPPIFNPRHTVSDFTCTGTIHTRIRKDPV